MKNEPKRARRRRDLARMKARAKRIYPEYPRAINKANHIASCSCWMCGNPRRYLGERTVGELRAEEAHDARP